MNQLLIYQPTIVNEGETFIGSLFIDDGFITRIFKNPEEEQQFKNTYKGNVIDARGLYLIPGIIDDHVHFREPGFPDKATMHSESRAAVAGGVTSIMEMPNTNPQTTSIEALEDKFNIASSHCLTNHSFYIGATNENIKEIKSCNPSRVCGVKLFMGSSTGNMLVNEKKALEALFDESPLLIAIHSEDESTIRSNLEVAKHQYGEDIPFSAHPHIRNREACMKSTTTAIELAKKYNQRLHVLHLSTYDELQLFSAGNINEKRITAEACMNHILFNDRMYEKLGALIKVNPAIKSEKDQQAITAAIRSNKIDIIATDHAPHTYEEKQNKYLKAPSGAPMIQHSLPSMLELWKQDQIKLEEIVWKMCHNPAELFKIENRGYIRENYAADLTIFDPNHHWAVSSENILYHCQWSPLMGKQFTTLPVYTIINGNIIYNKGQINEQYTGQPLTFMA